MSTLTFIVLSLGGITPSYSSEGLPVHACPHGYVQRSRIILGCDGGVQRMNFELASTGRPHHLMFWQAPAGTQHLSATALLKPTHGGNGKASLSVNCVETGQVLIGSDDGVLNRHKFHAKIHGAHWQWGSDFKSDYGEEFEEWFRVDGSLPCDVVVTLRNDASTLLSGSFHYEWASIHQCPKVPLGCKPCAQEGPDCMDVGMIAVCDGSPNITCKAASALTSQGTTHKPLIAMTSAPPILATSTNPKILGPSSATALRVPRTTPAEGPEKNFGPSLEHVDATNSISGTLLCILLSAICLCACIYVRRSRQTRLESDGISLPRHHGMHSDDHGERANKIAPSLRGDEKFASVGGYEPVRSDDTFDAFSVASDDDVEPLLLQ